MENVMKFGVLGVGRCGLLVFLFLILPPPVWLNCYSYFC
jgi:hypothetical protein